MLAAATVGKSSSPPPPPLWVQLLLRHDEWVWSCGWMAVALASMQTLPPGHRNTKSAQRRASCQRHWQYGPREVNAKELLQCSRNNENLSASSCPVPVDVFRLWMRRQPWCHSVCGINDDMRRLLNHSHIKTVRESPNEKSFHFHWHLFIKMNNVVLGDQSILDPWGPPLLNGGPPKHK